MRTCITVGLASLLALSSFPLHAEAAVLTGIQGNVLVRTEAGVVPVSASPAQVSVGDLVTVSEDAQATLLYDDGCSQELDSRSVTTVGALSPCALAPPADVVATPAADPMMEEDDPVPVSGLVIGGVAIAAGIGAIILLSDDDDPNELPTSP